MSKKDFIALADAIREHNKYADWPNNTETRFAQDQLDTLARFCTMQNPNFNRSRWLDYIKVEDK